MTGAGATTHHSGLGLALGATQPPDLLVLDAGGGTQLARLSGVGWGPMTWQPRP